MTITLYKCSDENTKVSKSLTSAFNLSGTLRQETSIVNPVIRINGDSSIVGYNYAYIPEFSRYYFITDIVAVVNGIWDISFSVDVLMSYKQQILALPVIVRRQESNFNSYLSDGQRLIAADDTINIVQPSGSYSYDGQERYFLLVAGGNS